MTAWPQQALRAEFPSEAGVMCQLYPEFHPRPHGRLATASPRNTLSSSGRAGAWAELTGTLAALAGRCLGEQTLAVSGTYAAKRLA